MTPTHLFIKANRTTWKPVLLLALALAFPRSSSRAQEAGQMADTLRRFESRLEALESENRALRDQVRELTEARIPVSEGGTMEPEPEPAAAPAIPAPAATSGAPAEEVGLDEDPDVPTRIPLKAWLDKGFVLSSDDDEYQLQFHNETQVEYRGFGHTGQGTVHNGFFIPRQIWTMSGRFTKSVDYLASWQRGLGHFELRDAQLNFHALPDKKLIVRVGRFRSPYSYEYHAQSNVELISPERSVFNMNFSNLRVIGGMAWGLLADDRIDYAAAIVNDSRNGYENVVDQPSFAGYLNFRPFRHSERLAFLNYLNVGASTDLSSRGHDQNVPLALRTSTNASASTGSSTASPAFLAFNEGVRENGAKSMGGVHMAWFYNRLSLLAEWNFGAEQYIRTPHAPRDQRVTVPIQGYYVQSGFFLTGEHLTHRGLVDVKRPFNLKRGKDFGLGAIELAARYAELELGNEVFTGGLADPNLWTNRVQITDIGFNWYLNRYLKVYLDWQHSQYGAPITYGTGRFLLDNDLYWARLQLLF